MCVACITACHTKYYNVVAALDKIAANRMTRVTVNPPFENKCEHLKATFLACYDFTDEEAAVRLKNHDCLGDRRPSDMLAYILSLNCSNPTGTSFRERFLQQLPNDVRVTLAALQLRDLNALAIAAGAVTAILISSGLECRS